MVDLLQVLPPFQSHVEVVGVLEAQSATEKRPFEKNRCGVEEAVVAPPRESVCFSSQASQCS